MAHGHALLLASPLALALALASSDASAFCRSTTCRGEKCVTDADGCPTVGAKLAWPTSCVSFSLQKNGTEKLDFQRMNAAVTKAFQHWAEMPCPGGGSAAITFMPTEDVSCKKQQYNSTGPNVNVVFFEDEYFPYRGIDGTLAKTSVTYNDDTGEIYDADIVVNSANNHLTDVDPPKQVDYDLEAIMTHEVGHFIGIAHSPDPDAVMSASYSTGSTSQRTLTPDDVGALCAIYPPGRKASCKSEPRGGFAASCDDAKSGSGCAAGATAASEGLHLWPAALAAGGLALVLGRRRRSRS